VLLGVPDLSEPFDAIDESELDREIDGLILRIGIFDAAILVFC